MKMARLQRYWNAYRKFPKYLDTQKIYCNHSKIWTMWLYHRVLRPNDADGMASSVDPDQTAPLGAVWSGSELFAQAYLSENLGSLRVLYDFDKKTGYFLFFLSIESYINKQNDTHDNIYNYTWNYVSLWSGITDKIMEA